MEGSASRLDSEAMLTGLAEDEALPLPSRFCLASGGQASNKADVTEYLAQLLLNDPGVFLERYGNRLCMEDLQHFDGFAGVQRRLSVVLGRRSRRMHSGAAFQAWHVMAALSACGGGARLRRWCACCCANVRISRAMCASTTDPARHGRPSTCRYQL